MVSPVGDNEVTLDPEIIFGPANNADSKFGAIQSSESNNLIY